MVLKILPGLHFIVAESFHVWNIASCVCFWYLVCLFGIERVHWNNIKYLCVFIETCVFVEELVSAASKPVIVLALLNFNTIQ